jgi:hypothetical protein
MSILKSLTRSRRNRQRSRRPIPAPASSLLALVCVGCLALLAAPAISAPVRARAAKVLAVNDKAALHFVAENGSQTTEEGTATGTLPGTVRAQLTLGTTVLIRFTLYLRGGSISGQATAKLNPGKGAYASFGGSLHVTHGSGHYRHVSGSGGLYGTINRNQSNAATVQVVGHLHL